MGYYSEAIVRHIVTHVASEGKEAYQKYFNAALKKFGVKSPAELSGDKKKEFFNYIDNGYKAQNESSKEYGKTLDKMARDRKLKMLSKKDKELLAKIADMMKHANEGKLSAKVKKAIMIAIKMSGDMTGAVDKIEKIAKGLSDDDQVAAALRLANEACGYKDEDKDINEMHVDNPINVQGYDKLRTKYKHTGSWMKSLGKALKRQNDWDVYQSVRWLSERFAEMNAVLDDKKYVGEGVEEDLEGDEENPYKQAIKNFLDAALKKAGIKVKKHKPMKRGWLGNKIYGCFYTVKSAGKDDVMPFTVDKKGRIDLGVSSEDWIIGKYGEMNKVVKNLKMYKKDDLDVRESIREDLDPYKDFGTDNNWERNYDLNLGAFVEHYQDLVKFMKKHKPVPDKNKRAWANAIREKIGRPMLNGHMSQMRNIMDLLQMGEKFRKLKDEDGWVLGESVTEDSEFTMKIDAYQNAMKALDHYVDVLADLGAKKKSKLALGLLKKLQKSFFAKENMDPKLKEVASPLVDKLDSAIEDIETLLNVANSDEADDAFEKPKPSKKALIATMKLLKKVK